jgi:hypothetical protein
MVILQEDNVVNITRKGGHYEGCVNGKFIVSGDTWKEVYTDLLEMGYLR